LSHVPGPFWSGYYSHRVFLSAQASDSDPPTYASHLAGLTDTHHHILFVCWDRGLTNFLSGLASNCNPPCLHLPNSWDYRPELLHPSSLFLFLLWIYHRLVIHSPVEDNLGYFHFGVIISKAMINICLQFFVE
jgi:hypothetical protein